jgi:hypothetical protein
MKRFYNRPLRESACEGNVSYITQRHLSVLDALDHAAFARAWPASHCSSINVHNQDFYGTPNRDVAFELASLGWAEGRQLMSKARAQMPKSSARVHLMEWDVGGDYPDPVRAAAGAPDCMITRGNSVECPNQVIRVVVSASTPCYTPPSEYINRGAAILSAIEAAELCGYPIQVEVEETSFTFNQGFSCSILLKEAGHPCDLDSLAFFLIHPSSLRRVFFALLETENELINMHIGYGIPTCRPTSLHKPGDIYLPNFETGVFTSPTAAHQLVQEAFKRVGCSVEFPDTISTEGRPHRY